MPPKLTILFDRCTLTEKGTVMPLNYSIWTAIEIRSEPRIVSVTADEFSVEFSFEVNNRMSDDEDLRTAEFSMPLSFQK